MPAPSLKYHIVNAFIGSTPHSGNQAAVVLYPNDTDSRINDEFFRLTARDFHFSETAFLVPVPAANPNEPTYRIRFWTPTVEVPLCGHATLASAYTTLYAVHPDADAIVFDTHHGLVRCVRSDTGGVVLDMPAHVAAVPDAETDKSLRNTMLASAPSLKPADLLRVGRLTDFGDGDRVVYELASSVDLEKLPVDNEHFNSEATGQAIVTQLVGADSNGLRINSRIFCPYWGVPEDPVVRCVVSSHGQTDTLRRAQRTPCWDHTTSQALARRTPRPPSQATWLQRSSTRGKSPSAAVACESRSARTASARISMAKRRAGPTDCSMLFESHGPRTDRPKLSVELCSLRCIWLMLSRSG